MKTEYNFSKLKEVLVLCPDPIAITLDTHRSARVVAAALESGCSVLYSEDFQDGQVIAGQLTVRNPVGKKVLR